MGRGDSGAPGGEIANATGARISPDGRVIAVLDRDPPFVKLFDREGKLTASFLGRGQGPGEAMHPVTVAVSDSLIVVADIGAEQLLLFDHQGRFQRAMKPIAFMPLAAVAACAGDWVFYGPAATHGRANWIHRVRLSAAEGPVMIGSVFEDTVPEIIGFGKPYGLVATDSGAIARHDQPDTRTIVDIACEEGSVGLRVTTATRRAVGGEKPKTRVVESADPAGGDGMVVGMHSSITLGADPQKQPAGVGLVDGHLLVADGLMRLSLGDVAFTTRFELGTDASARQVVVDGLYVIYDSRRGIGTLVGTSDPTPNLFIVRDDALSNLIR
jgi:hypothetical protein